MKIFNIKSIALTLSAILFSIVSQAQISKAEIIATGLTCSMCSNAINKQLEAMPVVDTITTDLNTNTFSVFFKPDTTVEPSALKEAVEKAGFFVGSLVLTLDVNSDQYTDSGFNLGKDTYTILDKEQPSTPQTKYRVIDKGFVTQREFKKLSKTHSKVTGYKTGVKNNYHLQAI